MKGPVNAALFQILSQRLNGAQELSLLDGEGADRELHRRSLLKQQHGFEQGERVFAAGERHGHAVALANHFEAADGFADLVQ